MLILVLFAFLGGLVTILSPCILPILPLILSGSVTGGRQKPYGIITGFVVSFTFFTLFLSAIVRATGLPSDALRTLSIILITFFGLSLLFPQTQVILEKLTARLTPTSPHQNHQGFWGGLLLGLSLGLLWAPCVGPILAAIITLAATSSVTGQAVVITAAYALGTAIPMLVVTQTGRSLFQRHPWLLQKSARIQKVFGVIMILVAIAIFFNLDRRFQAYVLEKFPSYGLGLTSLEDNQLVKNQLNSLQNQTADQDATPNLPPGKKAPEINGGTQWLNSQPLTLEALKGKVVLIDFWTYSCINCIRTFPYLRSWHEKYAPQGLVIIGVHAPEFEFEKSTQNVQQALNDFDLTYPVVQDNDFTIWRAFNNRYWPAKYLIDKNGYIRYTHFGEGKYDETEQVIQTLLKEAGANPDQPLTDMPEFDNQTQTPETYLGYDRIDGFSGSPSIQKDQLAQYTAPATLAKNRFAFQGNWLISKEAAAPQSGATLTYRFQAKQVHLVVAPVESTAQFQVLLNGQPLESIDGTDVNEQGIVTAGQDRLYTLVNLDQAGDHVLTLKFLNGNARLFAFTFG